MLNAPRTPRRAAASLLMLALLAAGAAAVPAPARADTVRDAQMWVLDAVSAPSAWSVTRGQGATVAVIDSGVNPAVSDLAGSVTTGPDLTGVHTPPGNPNWGVHGTWMASLIAGHGHAGGGSGIMGVAPASKILSIRVVTDRHDPGYSAYEHESDGRVQDALAQAITYAIRHRADVISMSLGYGEPSTVVRSALQDALDHGIVVVASSGNSGNSANVGHAGQAPYSFPADYPGVLGVAAVSRSGSPAGFSSDNLSVQVAAPGVNVPGPGPGRAVLAGQRDQPGLRPDRGRRRADQGEVPGAGPGPGRAGHHLEHPEPPGRRLRQQDRVRHGGRRRRARRRREDGRAAARPGRRGHHAALRRRRRGGAAGADYARGARPDWSWRACSRWLSWPRPAWPGGGCSACAGPCPGGTTPRTGRRSRSGPARRFTPPGRTGRIRAQVRSRP